MSIKPARAQTEIGLKRFADPRWRSTWHRINPTLLPVTPTSLYQAKILVHSSR